jgi:hypothetical protein
LAGRNIISIKQIEKMKFNSIQPVDGRRLKSTYCRLSVRDRKSCHDGNSFFTENLEHHRSPSIKGNSNNTISYLGCNGTNPRQIDNLSIDSLHQLPAAEMYEDELQNQSADFTFEDEMLPENTETCHYDLTSQNDYLTSYPTIRTGRRYRSSIHRGAWYLLPGLKSTSCLTIVLLVFLETVLLSTVSNCAKTFYMHWNTTNSM